MAYWLKTAGTGQTPFTDPDWRPRYEGWRRERGPISAFPRRPSIRSWDRLVVYAAGSALEFGEGRVFALEEVLSPEPEPSGHERWRWQLQTRMLVAGPPLSHCPTLRDIEVSPRSLRQHSHIRLTDDQGRRAEDLLRRLAS
jgi:hypothetical protein